jgi:hypothetical protein
VTASSDGEYLTWLMPRTADEIISQAEEPALRFQDHEPDVDAIKDASAIRELRRAFLARAGAEQRVIEAVVKARANGHSWARSER